MNVNAELALAAARVRLLTQPLADPEDRAAEAWADLLSEVDSCYSDGAKILAIIEWRQRFESRFRAHA